IIPLFPYSFIPFGYAAGSTLNRAALSHSFTHSFPLTLSFPLTHSLINSILWTLPNQFQLRSLTRLAGTGARFWCVHASVCVCGLLMGCLARGARRVLNLLLLCG